MFIRFRNERAPEGHAVLQFLRAHLVEGLIPHALAHRLKRRELVAQRHALARRPAQAVLVGQLLAGCAAGAQHLTNGIQRIHPHKHLPDQAADGCADEYDFLNAHVFQNRMNLPGEILHMLAFWQ